MGKIFKISLFLIAIVLSFYNVSFGDQLTKGKSPTNSSNELIYGQWILHRKGEPPFPSPDKAGFGSTLSGCKPNKAIGTPESSMNPEVRNTMPFPVTTEFRKEEMSDFENRQLSRGKSGYHSGEMYLTRNHLNPSLSFISSLSSVRYEEGNLLSWAPEKFKENDIFRSLAIFLGLKLDF